MPADHRSLSVVISTYNGAAFLRQQLDSIVQQTLPPDEIVVVDDASTDDTVAIVREYAAVHHNFVIVVNAERLGYVKTFEKGLLRASGDLIALSDQDDVWVTHKLATLVHAIGGRLIVYSDSELIDERGHSLHRRMSNIRNQVGYDNCLMYALGAWAPGHAMLVKRQLVDLCSHFPDLVTHDFWLGFVATCHGSIGYVPEPLVQYRQHGANAIGAGIGVRRTRARHSRRDALDRARRRMQLLYEKCPPENVVPKQVLRTLHKSYASFSLRNDYTRMTTFFRYRHLILAYKKKTPLMKVLFCVKMFFTIV